MSEPVFLPNMDHLRVKDPKLYETIRVIQRNMNPSQQPAPPQVSGITVTAANGFFTVTLTDNGQVKAGIHYFIEYSTTNGFQQPVVIDNGASRTLVVNLGNQTLFWRAYSQYIFPFSPPSSPVTFGGSTPTGVAGGGAVAPPAVSSTGSGTASTTGQQGGSGFGRDPVRPGPTRL